MMAVKDLWNNEIFINGGKLNSFGVTILLNNNSKHEKLSCQDKNGNYRNLLLTINLGENTFDSLL